MIDPIKTMEELLRRYPNMRLSTALTRVKALMLVDAMRGGNNAVRTDMAEREPSFFDKVMRSWK